MDNRYHPRWLWNATRNKTFVDSDRAFSKLTFPFWQIASRANKARLVSHGLYASDWPDLPKHSS